MLARIAAAAVVAWVIFANVARAGVITVDAAGGANFTTIQAGIDAAVDGDIVVITAGNYSPNVSLTGCVVDGKSLTLVASPPGGTFELRGFEARNLAAGKTLVVRGLRVDGFSFVSSPVNMTGGARVLSCAGAIAFEDCSFTGFPADHFFGGTTQSAAGLIVTNAATVVLTRCTLVGGYGINDETPIAGAAVPGAAGAQITGSKVAAFDTSITGGANFKFPQGKLAAGGPGAAVTTGTLACSGCTITGGAALQVTTAGTPGPGLLLKNVAAFASLLDTVVVGGSSSAGPGPAIVPGAGTVTIVPAAARSFDVTSPVQPGAPVTVEIDGLQNDVVLFFVSTNAGYATPFGLQGVLATSLPVQGAFVLTTIASPTGQATIAASAPPLLPGVTGKTFLLHPVFVNGGDAVSGSPTAFTLVQ